MTSSPNRSVTGMPELNSAFRLPTNKFDDMTSAVHYALETTRAIAVCPFHLDVVIRVDDNAAETHAYRRAKNLQRIHEKPWNAEALRREFKRQLSEAADRHCPRCIREVRPARSERVAPAPRSRTFCCLEITLR